MESNNILDELKCPICLEIPADKIFLCENGHIICDICLLGIKDCPQCRVSLKDLKVRNRTLEVLLDTFKFECAYKGMGCNEKVGRKDIKLHVNNCSFGEKNILLCDIIGYSCKYATNLRSLAKALEHFTASHQFIVRTDTYFPIHMKDLAAAANFKLKKKPVNSIWTPIQLNISHSAGTLLTNEGYSTIIILSSNNGKDKSMSWMCVHLSGEFDPIKYHAEFLIKSESKEAPDLSWRIPAVDASQLHTMFPRSPFRIPKELLLQHYVQKNGDLVINAKVIALKGKRIASVIHNEPSCIYNSLFHQNANSSSITATITSDEMVFESMNCEDCGVSIMSQMYYMRLEGQNYNLCNICVSKDAYKNYWFAEIKNAEQAKVVSSLWKKRQAEWADPTENGPSFSSHPDPCKDNSCPIVYTCLQCTKVTFCECNKSKEHIDHPIGVFLTKIREGVTAKLSTTTLHCKDCGLHPLNDVYYQSLQGTDFSLCKLCINKSEHCNKWFAVITSHEQEESYHAMWYSKTLQWSVYGVPLQSTSSVMLCSMKGCLNRGIYTCLECDSSKHLSACSKCVETNGLEKQHLLARYICK